MVWQGRRVPLPFFFVGYTQSAKGFHFYAENTYMVPPTYLEVPYEFLNRHHCDRGVDRIEALQP